MQKLCLVLVSALLVACQGKAQSQKEDIAAIKTVVKNFVAAGDAQDVSALAPTLHESYRIVWNDLSEGKVKIVDRASYLNFIEQKIFGGDPRTISFEQVDIFQGHIAQVKATLTGEKATFYNYLSLVKADGKWTIAQDQVMMQPRSE